MSCPFHVTSATELAALDFPQPVQASVLADAPSTDAGQRHEAPRLPETPCRDIRHRRPSDTPKGRPPRQPPHPAAQDQHTHVPRKGQRNRVTPDPRHLAERERGLPRYKLPVHDSAITGTGAGNISRRRLPAARGMAPCRNAGPRRWRLGRPRGNWARHPDWTDEGMLIAGDDDSQHGWDTGPESPTPPHGTPRRYPARRPPARLIATTALVILCIIAITFVLFPRNHTIRIAPADNPAATASQPTPRVQSGGTTPATAEPATLTRADAERILASYWQVNNTANESRSDTLLKTIEAGSSYSMEARRHLPPDGTG